MEDEGYLYDSTFDCDTRSINNEVRNILRTNDSNVGPSQKLIQSSPMEATKEPKIETSKTIKSEAPCVMDSSPALLNTTSLRLRVRSPSELKMGACLTNTTRRANIPQLSDSHSSVAMDCSSGNVTSSSQSKDDNLSKISGIPKQGKTLKLPCGSTCRQKCFQKFTPQQREHIFNEFWKLDYAKQCAFIVEYVKVYDHSTIDQDHFNTTNYESRRKKSFKYFLPLYDSDIGRLSHSVCVCKTMFLNTLSIVDRVVYTAFSKNNSGDTSIHIREKPKKTY